ncbi:hypothetical protein HPB51_017257 [Rhipicephalus microplus]|uniref:Uncharacterized protein n=1 Tax=Rhipicephalus microplus TaxID=6941 RepID=A0A9J6EU54_RHIMP|nr:hypothetical protein HPB51_017257 [Rhipicephalus microplus]
MLRNNGGKYEGRLALLFLDLKTSSLSWDKKFNAGVDVARKLLDHLWHGVSVRKAMNVLLSVPSVNDKEVFRGAVRTVQRQEPEMIKKIGFDVSNNDELAAIGDMYRQLGIQGHRWQGDGITNCFSFLRSTSRLESVIENRDAAGVPSGYVDKAYHWTIDMPHQLRLSLRKNVDGIITNMPQYLADILKEEEFRDTVRLANAGDNPWTRFERRYSCNDQDSFIAWDVLGGGSEG